MKRFFSNAWVVGILGSIIATFIMSAITAVYNKINIIQAINLLYSWLVAIFSYKVPLYMIIGVIIFLIIVAKILSVIITVKDNNKPKWLNYTKAQYKNWFMKWEYHLNFDNKYSVENLRPICKCGCELSSKDSFKNVYYRDGVLVCPKCENTYPAIESSSIEDFHKILIHNIQNEDFPQNL